MRIKYSKTFNRRFDKLSAEGQAKVISAVAIFVSNPLDHKLRYHELKGQLRGVFSISAGFDLRLHFVKSGDDEITFVAVSSHSQLYK